MKTLLLITCSPRGQQSNSYQLAEHFTQGLVSKHPDEWQIDTLDLWQQSLPQMDRVASSAKYAVMSGMPLTAEEQSSWEGIEKHCRLFINADVVVIALPMWNFGVPYVLKHYIDVITQPGLCFKWTPEAGYTPVVEPKRCVLVSSSAADYTPSSGNEHNDFCIPYLKQWLKVYFGYQADHLCFAPTVPIDTDVAVAKKNAFDQANTLITTFY